MYVFLNDRLTQLTVRRELFFLECRLALGMEMYTQSWILNKFKLLEGWMLIFYSSFCVSLLLLMMLLRLSLLPLVFFHILLLLLLFLSQFPITFPRLSIHCCRVSFISFPIEAVTGILANDADVSTIVPQIGCESSFVRADAEFPQVVAEADINVQVDVNQRNYS